MARAIEHRDHHLLVDVIVLGEKNAQTLTDGLRGFGWHTRFGLGFRCARSGKTNREPKTAALTRTAVDADVAPHLHAKLLANRKTQPGAAMFATARRVDLSEPAEELRPVVLGYAGAGVGHLEPDHDRIPASLLQRHPKGHRSSIGELDRIADEVEKDLPQPSGVALEAGGDGWSHGGRYPQLLGARLGGHQIDDAAHDIVQCELDDLQLELARFQLGEIKNVIDDGEQGIARVSDRFDVVALLVRQIGAKKHPGHSENSVHRSSDLVAHRGQKIVLHAICFLSRFLGLD